jgi:hypothetical protein
VLGGVFVGVAVLVGVFVGVAVLVGVFVGVGVAVGARISTSAQTHPADTTSSGLKAARASTLAQFSVLGVGFRALKCSVMVRLAPGSQRAGVPSSGECSRVSQSMWPNQYQAVSWGSAGLIKARYSGSKSSSTSTLARAASPVLVTTISNVTPSLTSTGLALVRSLVMLICRLAGVEVAVGVLVAVLVAVLVGVGVLVGVLVAVLVGVAVLVAVLVGVSVGVDVLVAVLVGVFVGVGVLVAVLVGVFVGVAVLVAVLVGVFVGVAVSVAVLVGVRVGVLVAVGVGVLVGVSVGVGVGVATGIMALGFIWTSLLGMVLMCRLDPGQDEAPLPAPTPGSSGDARWPPHKT